MNALAFGWDGLDAAVRHAERRNLPLAVHRGAMEQMGWERAVQRLRGASFPVSAVLHSSPFTLDEPGRWAQERAVLYRSIEAAAQVGSGIVCLTSGVAGVLTWEEARDRLAEAVAPVLPVARPHDVRLVIEPTGQLRHDIGFASTLRDVVALARGTGLGVCVDTYWCWREPGLAQTIAAASELIHLIQISDHVTTMRMGDRAVPGDGIAHLDRMLRLLHRTGYDGYLDLEILGPRIRSEGPEVAVDRGIRYLEQLLARTGSAVVATEEEQ